ncbi:MAG: hypothetical protein K6G08_02680 [Prevotella sp.]|nr:hypothetical protein [Prevotella sp.]
MKKFVFAMLAVAAMTLAACGGKTAAPGQADQQAPMPESADQVTASLDEGLKSGDQGTFKAKLMAIIEKVKDLATGSKVEQAKEYAAKAKEFLAANKDKVTNLIGNNEELSGLVNMITSDNFVSGFLGNLPIPDAVKEQIPEGAADAINNLIK